MGGRLQYEYLCSFSKRGVAQYFLTALDYNIYKKEPEGIWWDNNSNIIPIQPRLGSGAFMFGYGIGLNFLGRIELMPYLLAGYQMTMFTGSGKNPVYWNHDREIWDDLMDDKSGEKTTIGHGLIGNVGLRLNINLWYPLQLTKGFKPIVSLHEINRLNLYAGLRLHF